MTLGFGGEVADFYQRYRRGYPVEVIDGLVEAYGLTDTDLVVDLGCGTGQLTLPLAGRVRAAIGVDPEPDMLSVARRAAASHERSNLAWMLGSDADAPALSALLGEGSVAAVTIGQALHWMDAARLFGSLAPLFRPGGGIAIVTNGRPLWQQDSAFSRALAGFLGEWLGSPLTKTCGTDDAEQQHYRQLLGSAGYAVGEFEVRYSGELTIDEVVGGVYSAMPVDRLPAPDDRPAFAADVSAVLEPHAPFIEDVQVRVLIGRRR